MNRSSFLYELAKQVKAVVNSVENQKKQEFCHKHKSGIPGHKIPVFYDLWESTYPIFIVKWCKLLGITLDWEKIIQSSGDISREYAERLLTFQLNQKLTRWKMVHDDTPLDDIIHTNLGLCWMARVGHFGERYEYEPSEGSYITIPYVTDESDMSKVKYVPHSGCDETLHNRRVQVFRDLVGDNLTIVDDSWDTPLAPVAPFAVASRLRGAIEILIDMRLQPHLVHRLMRKVTDLIIEFYENLPEALREEATFGSDDVNSDVFSPNDYREFILPYEKEIAVLFRRVYYHSCGNLTPLYGDILELPNLYKIHVSPWSDLRVACEIFGNDVIIQKFMDPERDIERVTTLEMREKVRDVLDIAHQYRLEIGVPGETLRGIELVNVVQEELRAYKS